MERAVGPGQAAAMVRYGNALRKAIRAEGLTQKKFAADLSTTESNLSMIVTGRRLPHPDTARRFAQRLESASGTLNALFEQARRIEPTAAPSDVTGASSSPGQRPPELSPPPQPPLAVAGLRPLPVFVGRESELTTIQNILHPSTDSTGCVLIAGFAGVGKTALATQAATRAISKKWFPGGVLMVDLRGYHPMESQAEPKTTLESLLSAVGIVDEYIPPDQEARERLWRSVLSEHDQNGRRMLLIADNASRAEQVRPILPGSPTSHRSS